MNGNGNFGEPTPQDFREFSRQLANILVVDSGIDTGTGPLAGAICDMGAWEIDTSADPE
jgi:hypothetical protein